MTVRERPILLSGQMVRPTLAGLKTQTRRVAKFPPYAPNDAGLDIQWAVSNLKCPYGQPGDRLYVKETWAPDCTCDDPKCNGVIYRADYAGEIQPDKWIPSIHMPRWASRILLEIVSVRLERLQDISEEDAIAEGIIVPPGYMEPWAAELFRDLWDSINGKRPGYSWADNPWVWRIEFKVLSALTHLIEEKITEAATL